MRFAADSASQIVEEQPVNSVCHKSGDLAHKSGDLTHKTGDLAHKTGDRAHKTGDLAHTTGNLHPEVLFESRPISRFSQKDKSQKDSALIHRESGLRPKDTGVAQKDSGFSQKDSGLRVVHLGLSTCHAISARGISHLGSPPPGFPQTCHPFQNGTATSTPKLPGKMGFLIGETLRFLAMCYVRTRRSKLYCQRPQQEQALLRACIEKGFDCPPYVSSILGTFHCPFSEYRHPCR